MISRVSFYFMCFWFWIRDLRSPPKNVLGEAGIAAGFRVLDYGCGPGSFSLAAAEMVGREGKVYAADITEFVVRRVERIARKKGLTNIETILTDCATGLDSGSIDVALVYDTYHDLENAGDVLNELHRVLKPGGVMSFSDHHIQGEDIVAGVTSDGLFALSGRGEKTHTFARLD